MLEAVDVIWYEASSRTFRALSAARELREKREEDRILYRARDCHIWGFVES